MRKYKANRQNLEADVEELHREIVNQVKAGEYETHMEALAAYMERYDIDEKRIIELISPALKAIIYDEAISMNMVFPPKFSIIPEELF